MIPPSGNKVQLDHRVVERQWTTIDYREENQNYIVDIIHNTQLLKVTSLSPRGYIIVFTE